MSVRSVNGLCVNSNMENTKSDLEDFRKHKVSSPYAIQKIHLNHILY